MICLSSVFFGSCIVNSFSSSFFAFCAVFCLHSWRSVLYFCLHSLHSVLCFCLHSLLSVLYACLHSLHSVLYFSLHSLHSVLYFSLHSLHSVLYFSLHSLHSVCCILTDGRERQRRYKKRRSCSSDTGCCPFFSLVFNDDKEQRLRRRPLGRRELKKQLAVTAGEEK